MQFGGGAGVVKLLLLFIFVSVRGSSRLERVEGEVLEKDGKEAAGPEDELGGGEAGEVEGEF